jgi:hypothetical protein
MSDEHGNYYYYCYYYVKDAHAAHEARASHAHALTLGLV